MTKAITLDLLLFSLAWYYSSLICILFTEKGTKVSKSKAAQKDKLKQPVISKVCFVNIVHGILRAV